MPGTLGQRRSERLSPCHPVQPIGQVTLYGQSSDAFVRVHQVPLGAERPTAAAGANDGRRAPNAYPTGRDPKRTALAESPDPPEYIGESTHVHGLLKTLPEDTV